MLWLSSNANKVEYILIIKALWICIEMIKTIQPAWVENGNENSTSVYSGFGIPPLWQISDSVAQSCLRKSF